MAWPQSAGAGSATSNMGGYRYRIAVVGAQGHCDINLGIVGIAFVVVTTADSREETA